MRPAPPRKMMMRCKTTIFPNQLFRPNHGIKWIKEKTGCWVWNFVPFISSKYEKCGDYRIFSSFQTRRILDLRNFLDLIFGVEW